VGPNPKIGVQATDVAVDFRAVTQRSTGELPNQIREARKSVGVVESGQGNSPLEQSWSRVGRLDQRYP
jgi:hypothetical protein